MVDNLSALVRRGGRENDAESWLNVAEWAMYQRSRGRSVLFIHHAGKNGDQRGTSKREDILDTVIRLARPKDYDASREGARFTVEFLKDRLRSAGEPFEAALSSSPQGGQVWTIKTLENSRAEQIIELAELGLSVTEIAGELDINKSTASRALKKAVQEGHYKPRNKLTQPERNDASSPGKVVELKPRKRRDVDDES